MRLRRFLSLWGPVLLQAALLFYLSSQRIHNAPAGWDKVAHFAAYAVFSVFVVRALHGGFVPVRAGLALTAVALVTLYGVSDELHQRFVPGRDSSLLDLSADFLGAATAVTLLAFTLRKRNGARAPLESRRSVDAV